MENNIEEILDKFIVNPKLKSQLTTLFNKQIADILKPLLPEMNADDYGVWVRGQIVDRIKELE